MRTALLVGATGLVGQALLERLLADSSYDRVTTLARRTLTSTDARHQHHVVDFDRLDGALVQGDDVFCALGTTIKQAGSREAFQKVDLEYPRRIAQAARTNGARQFLLVSAIGANPNSLLFYNRVKGEVERAIGVQPFAGTYLFRPSLLLGVREEVRPGESVAEAFFKPFGWLLRGPLSNVRPIPARLVARAMVEVAKAGPGGIRVYDPRSMRAIAAGDTDRIFMDRRG